MTSSADYQRFVTGLNQGRHAMTMNRGDLVMHLAIDARAMSPSEAKTTIDSLVREGIITADGNYVNLSNLYDASRQQYVMKGKTGKKMEPRKTGVTGARHTKYIGPGHTQVTYAHRVLDIRFKESDEQFKKRQHQRRVQASKNRGPRDDTIYVDYDSNGQLAYYTKTGKKVDAQARSDKGKDAIIKSKLKRDSYTIEEMRALLRDDHWEEVTGNKRWSYDSKATVKEFNKYLKTRSRKH